MPARDVDVYITAAPAEAQPMLRQLRAAIRSAAPRAEESIGYGMPKYTYHGTLAYFAAFKRHVSLYAIHAPVQDAFADEVAPYRAGKGTLRFAVGRPLPVGLIKRLVRANVRANEAQAKTAKPARAVTPPAGRRTGAAARREASEASATTRRQRPSGRASR